MKKSLWKFIAGGIGLVVIAVGVLYLVNYIRYRESPEYRAEQYFKDLERRYREDTYGGDTPEETLQLFIDALKKGDVELASRYFVITEQEKAKVDLKEAKGKNTIDQVIKRIELFELSKKEKDIASFVITDINGVVQYQARLQKNSTNKWKILDL